MKAIIDKNIENLVPLFLRKRQEDIKLLSSFIRDHKYEDIKSIGHKVFGTAGNYGFLELADIARSMEIAAAEHDDNRLGELLKDFKGYVSNVEIEYI